MRKQTYKTQIGLILTVTLIGLMLPGLAEARALRVKAGVETKGLSHEPTLRGISSKVDDPSGRTPSEPAQRNLIPVLKEDPPTRTAGAGLQAVIVASREEGMVPFAVFFEGTNSRDRNGNYIGDSTTTADPQSVGLLGNDILEYIWDFGDGETFSGFNAAHVYETPGTYTVTLTIRDELGSESTTMPITVNAFSGETYCVSVSGDFADCPGEGAANPSYQFNSYSQAFTAIQTIQNNNIVQPGDRVLFHRGETFTYTTGINLGRVNNVIIGAYPVEGSLASRPLIKYEGSGGGRADAAFKATSCPPASSVTVRDLQFYLESASEARAGGFVIWCDADNMLFLRVFIDQYDDNNVGADGLFLVDSELKNTMHSSLGFGGDRLVFLNSTIGDRGTFHSHILYGHSVNRGVIVGNYFYNVMSGVRLAGNVDPGSWNVIVSENKFEEMGAPLGLTCTRGDGNCVNGQNNILFEKNYLHNEVSISRNGATDIVVRNNIFNIFNGVALHLKDSTDSAVPRGVNGLKFYGNTIYAQENTMGSGAVIAIEIVDHQDVEIFNNIIHGLTSLSWGEAIQVDYVSGMSEITSNNNLFYFPYKPDDQIFWVEGTAYNLEGWRSTFGEDLNSFIDNPSFITDPPSLPEHFRLNSSSPAIDTGMSLPLVFEDYDKNPRPIDGDTSGTAEWDIGAYEYALLTLPGDFDQDGDVDMDDYAMFEEAYTGANRPVAPGYEYADLDGDGDVDLDDFSIFAANYTGPR